jgi:hypothetical protein
MYTKLWLENTRRKDNLEELGTDQRIILKYVSEKEHE